MKEMTLLRFKHILTFSLVLKMYIHLLQKDIPQKDRAIMLGPFVSSVNIIRIAFYGYPSVINNNT